MADLPVERCREVPPFIYCGVDMFGPYLIKERRSQLKRYGALFKCFTCLAMHIEVTNALKTNSPSQHSNVGSTLWINVEIMLIRL